MAKAKFCMQKQGEALRFIGPKRPVYEAWVKGLPDKQVVDAEFKKHRNSKTNPQLGYLCGVIIPFAVEEFLKAGYDTLFEIKTGKFSVGVETNKITVDLLFKTLFKYHKSLDELPDKTNMTDETMSQLIDFSIEWLALNLHVVVPPPKQAVI